MGKIRSAKNRIINWCRMCVSACETLLVRTNVQRWRKVALAGRPSWDGRNKIIAGYIPAGSSVLDVGCGAQTLKQYLKPNCRYQPCDVIKSTPEVILCDFNAGIYPEIRERFDHVVCSGVLEYIRRPKEFLEIISGYGRSIIISYNPLRENESKIGRLGNGWGWVNHFKKAELESLFDEIGLKWIVLHVDKLAYIIYSIEQGKSPGRTLKLNKH